jgi:hypothetical protein
MANMSYCRFENTYHDLQDCLDNINQPASNERDERYRIRILNLLTNYLAYGDESPDEVLRMMQEVNK